MNLRLSEHLIKGSRGQTTSELSFRAAILRDCVLLVLRGEALGLFLGVFSSSVSSPSRVVRDSEVVRAVDEIRPRPSEGICGGEVSN